jgi:DNA replication and repair protein RecF
MYLENISLLNFKNYHHLNLEAGKGINIFHGNNGAGKTNLLDAIHYLSFCKSYFNSFDNQNILKGADMFVIQGTFGLNEGMEEIYCAQQRNERKQFMRNKNEYAKLSEHIGLLPVVMITPSDTDIICEGSDIRRRFVDSIIAQVSPVYLADLITYNKCLLQRNALLKRSYESHQWDKTLITVWDEQLIKTGTSIYTSRKNFTEEFSAIFAEVYRGIAGELDNPVITYSTQLSATDMGTLFLQSFDKDKQVLYTTSGIHKDDWQFNMCDMQVKKHASQGQQKSFIIALKIAQYRYLKKHKETIPILLLDDIFDKLDESRVGSLLELITGEDFEQVFITDTSPVRVSKLLRNKIDNHKVFPVVQGTIAGNLQPEYA